MDQQTIIEKSRRPSCLKLGEVQYFDNQLEVLPVSRNDDVIRYQTYPAIYRHPSLTRYAPGGGMTFADSMRFRPELYLRLQSTLQP